MKTEKLQKKKNHHNVKKLCDKIFLNNDANKVIVHEFGLIYTQSERTKQLI